MTIKREGENIIIYNLDKQNAVVINIDKNDKEIKRFIISKSQDNNENVLLWEMDYQTDKAIMFERKNWVIKCNTSQKEVKDNATLMRKLEEIKKTITSYMKLVNKKNDAGEKDILNTLNKKNRTQ